MKYGCLKWSEIIHEVRGKGLMIAVELTPEAGGARQYCEALKTRGILCKETHDHIIRFSPPLVLTNEQVDWAMERIGSTLRGQTQMHAHLGVRLKCMYRSMMIDSCFKHLNLTP